MKIEIKAIEEMDALEDIHNLKFRIIKDKT